MSQADIPAYLKDAAQLLSEDGFATSDVWYHGTSSGLLTSIKEKGLNRSGDRESNQSIKNTMATIGNAYTESVQPVFLTQSKQLAYYWAAQKARFRTQRMGQEEAPIVLEIKLDDGLKEKVRPDAGGAALIIARDAYIEYIEAVYADSEQSVGELDPMKMDGKTCLAKLGLAYLDTNVPAECIKLVSE